LDSINGMASAAAAEIPPASGVKTSDAQLDKSEMSD
jgi:hypothetical protein